MTLRSEQIYRDHASCEQSLLSFYCAQISPVKRPWIDIIFVSEDCTTPFYCSASVVPRQFASCTERTLVKFHSCQVRQLASYSAIIRLCYSSFISSYFVTSFDCDFDILMKRFALAWRNREILFCHCSLNRSVAFVEVNVRNLLCWFYLFEHYSFCHLSNSFWFISSALICSVGQHSAKELHLRSISITTHHLFIDHMRARMTSTHSIIPQRY